MSCFEKMKFLATRKEISQKEMSLHFKMPYNSFNNKLRACETRFNMKDLMKYAEACGLKIAFIDAEGNIVEELTNEDFIKKDNLI